MPENAKILSGESKREKSPISAIIVAAVCMPIPGIVVMGVCISSMISWIAFSISLISEVISLIKRMVCCSSRDFAGITEPIDVLAASRIAMAISRL